MHSWDRSVARSIGKLLSWIRGGGAMEAKKKNKKGKTLTLTDFLADDGNSGGGVVVVVVAVVVVAVVAAAAAPMPQNQSVGLMRPMIWKEMISPRCILKDKKKRLDYTHPGEVQCRPGYMGGLSTALDNVTHHWNRVLCPFPKGPFTLSDAAAIPTTIRIAAASLFGRWRAVTQTALQRPTMPRSPGYQVSTTWHSNEDDAYRGHPIDRSILPTAPRAAREPNVDRSRLPKSPPFTAFLGNLPYDVTEESIQKFFRGLNISAVRLPREPSNPERLKGFGYAEFDDLDSLLRALSLNEEGKHRVTKRGPALSNPMFTLVTGDLGIVGRWRAVYVTALQRPNSDAAAIDIVV
ncbi:unnamed protein product [Ranitomeya imitator]|uniref:RRM domain-containing protein n=1 Tax=Ranitomeya imitator TaxID=111125 RepID=A0ABN9L0J5_9NEOB|nr:unnamed protein product [Ranitomeya imitator]